MGQMLKRASSGGARLKYNLFVQPDEPAIKDGLWIKAPAAVPVSDIIVKGSYMRAGHFAAANDCEFNGDVAFPYGYRAHLMSNYFNGNVFFLTHQAYASDAPYKIYSNNVFTGTVSEVGTGQISGSTDYLYYVDDCFVVNQKAVFDCKTGEHINKNGYTGQEKGSVFLGKYKGYVYVNSYKNNYYYISRTNDSGATWEDIAAINYDKLVDYRLTYGAFYLDKLYGFSSATGKVCILNIITKTFSFGAVKPYQIIQYTAPTLYGNKFYLENNQYSDGHSYCKIYVYDIETDTFTLLDSLDKTSTPTQSGINFMCYIPGHGILCKGIVYSGHGTTGGDSFAEQFVLDSQSESIDTLCLQEGEEHRINILSTNSVQTGLPKKARSILNSSQYQPAKLSLSDAWYYDTDFREYPTFIGNGSTWTKIKN